VAWPSSCSRNAHDKNMLVRGAQSRIDQATLENEMGIGKTLAVEDQSALIPRENEQGLIRNKMRKEVKGPCPIASVAPKPLPVL